MSTTPETPNPLPTTEMATIRNRIAQSAELLYKKLNKVGSIDGLYDRVEPKPGSDDANMIDWLAMANYPIDSQKDQNKAFKVGLAVGMALGRKIAGHGFSFKYSRLSGGSPTLDSLFRVYGTTNNSAALDLTDYLTRNALSSPAEVIRRELPVTLKNPFSFESKVLTSEVNQIYAGSLCLIAADAVTVVQQRAMQNLAKVDDAEIQALTNDCVQYVESWGPPLSDRDVLAYRLQYQDLRK